MDGVDHFMLHDVLWANRTLLIGGQVEERSRGRINDDRLDRRDEGLRWCIGLIRYSARGAKL